MKKTLLAMAAMLCLGAQLWAQANLTIQSFTKLEVNTLTMPGNGTVVPTDDGGYFFAKGLTLTKYDSSNTVLWSHSLEGTTKIGYTNAITSVCDDGLGGAIITGKFHASLKKGNDSLTSFYTATGGNPFYSADAFVARVNATDKLWWYNLSEYTGDAPDEDKGISVVVKNQKVYWLAASKGRNVRFNNIDYALSNYSGNKALLVEFAMDGTIGWTSMTKGGGVVPAFLTASANEVFYSAYSTGSSTKIEFGNNISLQYNQASFFVVKYNPSGQALWAKTYDDDNSMQNMYGLTSDDNGDVYACGIGSNFSSSYGIKPGRGYLVKIKGTDGSNDWARLFSKLSATANVLHGPLIGVSFSNGSIYVGGNTNGDLYLQSNTNDSVQLKLSTVAGSEQFVAQYDKQGSLLKQVKASGGSAGGTLAGVLSSKNYLSVIGTFSTGLTFDSHTMPTSGANVGVYFIGFYSVKTGMPTTPTGLANNKKALAVAMYPNPVNHSLYLDMQSPGAHITVFTLEGKVALQADLLSHHAVIDVSSLSKGVYFVRIENGESFTTQKFIKE